MKFRTLGEKSVFLLNLKMRSFRLRPQDDEENESILTITLFFILQPAKNLIFSFQVKKSRREILRPYGLRMTKEKNDVILSVAKNPT